MFPSVLQLVVGAGLAWLILAIRVQHHTHAPQDFLLARQRLPIFAAELAAACAHVPLWLLLAIAVAAYRMGPPAAWFGGAAWLGTLFASLWLAPRLRARAQTHEAPTLARLLTVHSGDQLQAASRRSIVLIVTLCLLLAASVQLRWLAESLAPHLGLSLQETLIFAGMAILVCGLLGGFWLAAYTDALVLVLIILLSVVVLIAACYAAHGASGNAFVALVELFTAPTQRAPWEQTEHDDVLAVAFGVGVSFLIASSLAQPVALSRHLARTDASPRQRWVAPISSGVVLLVALLIGWCARIGTADGTSPLPLLAEWLSPGWLRFVLSLSICAGMAALLSPAIATAGLWAHDLPRKQHSHLLWYRWALVAIVALMSWLAYVLPADFAPLWLAWHALGASFAPLLIVQLSGKRVRAGSALGSIWAGFALTLIFHAMPDTTGDLLERAIPFITAMGIA